MGESIEGRIKTKEVANLAGISRQAVKARAALLDPPAVPLNVLGTDMWTKEDARRIKAMGFGPQHRHGAKKKAPVGGASTKKKPAKKVR